MQLKVVAPSSDAYFGIGVDRSESGWNCAFAAILVVPMPTIVIVVCDFLENPPLQDSDWHSPWKLVYKASERHR